MRKILKSVFSIERMMGVAMLFAMVAAYITNPYPVEFLRLKTFDYFQQLKPRQIPPPDKKPVTIVDLDEKSLAVVGQWPWARTTVAQLVENLFQMGAALVAFDVVFAEEDRLNPQNVAGTMKGLDPETQAKLKALPSNDSVLAETIKKYRVVVGQSGFWEDRQIKAGPPIRRSVGIKSQEGTPPLESFLEHLPDIVRNVPVIEQAAQGHGMFTITPETDGIVRRVPAFFVYNKDLYGALSVEMLRVAMGRSTVLVETDPAGVRAVRVTRDFTLPTDNKGRIWPYFSKQDKAKYVSAVDVLTGTADPELIKGKMIIVGTSAVGLLDIRATPNEPLLPGVEVHAQLIEAVANNAILTRPHYAAGLELLLLLGGGFLMIILVPWVGAKWTLAIFLAIVGGAVYGAWYMFDTQLMLLDPIFGSGAVMLLYMMLTYVGYAREESQRRQVRSAFGFYLSPAMVEQLAEDPTRLKLGGEKKNMSMLFCDVRGFTTISEMFDAEGLTKLINKLLTPLTGVILERKGTVDKYMGDCIMAFWNAPLDDADHARHACLSALEMNATMGPLNDKLAAEAAAENRKMIPLKVGIGVNSGDVVVGNMGSDQRFDYSILGDEVNLASRLEGQCKTYHVDIVLGQNTQAQVPGLATLELDLIKVKGKTEAVRVFTLLGDEQVAQSPAYRDLRAAHDGLLAAYRAQDWTAAKARLADCRRLMDGYNMAGYYEMMDERVAEFEQNPPGAEWDGVYVAKTK
ncbi:MAG: adenylate/guanylate cyclase domain-containing protein [Magnetospirillum sp. WYHS-4]